MRAALTALALAAALAAPAAAAPSSRQPVPILMYHVLAPPPATAPYPKLYLPPAEFRAQVAWLAAHGYHAVTLDEVFQVWHRGGRLPARPIVLSFDDGYRSDYTAALPVLRARRWPGVLNLEVANLKPVWGTRPGEVRALIRAGWEIDAHTLTHPDLTMLDAARLREQVAGSRAAIQRQFGVRADFFCYPSGRYNPTVEAAVRAAGFLGATTTDYGLGRPSSDPFALARVRVDGGDGARGLAAKLAALGLPR